MTRRSFQSAALCPALSAAAAFAQGRRRRNIVFILSDDHRHDFIGALGHPWLKGKTPNMDRMVANGVRFRNAFVTTSLCSPSRASILTSQYIFRHGVLNNSTPLSSRFPTFPQLLRANGYKTGFVGKWHMGGDSDEPRPGFDHWFSFRGQGQYFDPRINRNGTTVATKGYVADVLTEEAGEFIRQNRDQPFCLYLSHKNVHDPFVPAPRHTGVFKDQEIPYPASYRDTEENNRGKPDWVVRQRNSWHGAEGALNKPGGFEKLYRGYCESLLAVDESIGRVRDELTRLGLAEDTMLVYMGDNGYLHGEHGLIDKRVMYEPSIRVPLLVECPALHTRAAVRDELATNVDIAPTFLDFAGLPIPDGFQGRSLLPLLEGRRPADWRTEFVYAYFWEREAPQTPTILGLRTEQYSFMQPHGVWDLYELYDVKKDPDQTTNLLAGVRNGMSYGKVDRFITDPALKALFDDLQSRLRRQLESLGARPEPVWSAG